MKKFGLVQVVEMVGNMYICKELIKIAICLYVIRRFSYMYADIFNRFTFSLALTKRLVREHPRRSECNYFDILRF